MAHLVWVNRRPIRFYYDLDQNVGRNCPNLREDVHLVTQLYKLAGELDPALRPATSKITVGVANQALFDTITLSAKQGKWKDDGHVSSARGGIRYANGKIFEIVDLQVGAAELYADLWPRLDKMPWATDVIRELATRELVMAALMMP